jgi:hypothetical protein
MVRKTMIALAVALLGIVVPNAASAQQYCYGGPGIARCAGVGLGLYSPRWYFSDTYPYWIYDYPAVPYPAFRNVAGGCHLIRRRVLDPKSGWHTGVVRVCD